MPRDLARSFAPSELITLALLGILVVLLLIIAVRKLRMRRVPPEELERRRRYELALKGKTGDATLIEIREDLVVFYSYDVRGVSYTASQDISGLREYLPSDLTSTMGPILVKYDPKNPANSIICSEGWTGLRA